MNIIDEYGASTGDMRSHELVGASLVQQSCACWTGSWKTERAFDTIQCAMLIWLLHKMRTLVSEREI